MWKIYIHGNKKKKGDHTCKFFSLSFFLLLFRRFITLPSGDMGVDECEAGKLDSSTLESFQEKVWDNFQFQAMFWACSKWLALGGIRVQEMLSIFWYIKMLEHKCK